MDKDHTAPELLEAVGVDWRADKSLHTWDNGLTSTCHYTGPALGMQELDAILLVAGQRWLVSKDPNTHSYFYNRFEEGDWPGYKTTKCYGPFEWLLMECDTPGHALARAIREVSHA